jgi:hypothetical protein
MVDFDLGYFTPFMVIEIPEGIFIIYVQQLLLSVSIAKLTIVFHVRSYNKQLLTQLKNNASVKITSTQCAIILAFKIFKKAEMKL